MSDSRVRKSSQPAAMGCSSVAMGAVRLHHSEGSTIRALMDLALPKFADLEDRPVRLHRPWIVMTDPPASPAPVRSTGLLRSPSPCLNLDALSSDEDNDSAGPGDVLAAPICVSDDCHTPVNTDQVLSDEDLPAAAGTEDRRQVIRIRDVSPDVQIVDPSHVGRDWDTRQTVWGAKHPKDIPGGQLQQYAGVLALSPEVQAGDIPPGAGAADLTTMVQPNDVPQVGRMETVRPSTPLDSGWMSPYSPQTVTFDDMADSSVPLSPNRVQVGKSQDVPEEGSLFHVSPVTPGFLMRPSGAAVQQPGAGVPLPQAFTDPVLGDLIIFAQCTLIPGSDAPLILPVYTMPSGLAYMPGQSSVQTVLASAAFSRPEGWSSNTPRTTDISREGPFDAYTSPMDTGLPGGFMWLKVAKVAKSG